MEKLQPLLTHKFWILFGLALILPLYGWWSTTNAIATATTQRETALDGVYGKIPKKAAIKNQAWIEGAKKTEEVERRRLAVANFQLRTSQTELMTWGPRFRENGYMEGVPYWGAPKDRLAFDFYSNDYELQLNDIRKSLKPYSDTTGEGLVMIEPAVIPRVQREKLNGLSLTSTTMWEAQEDLWLLNSLFSAINKVNADAKNLQDSTVRHIEEIKLVGGSIPGTAAGVEGALAEKKFRFGGGRRGRDEEDGPVVSKIRRAGSGRADVAAEQAKEEVNVKSSVGFDVASVLGPVVEGEPIAVADWETTRPRARYVDVGAAMPYATRGFYIKLTMTHRQVPDLLAALSNADFPSQIVMVNQVDASVGGSNFAPVGLGGRRGLGRRGDDEEVSTGIPANQSKDISGPAMADPSLATVAIAGKMVMFVPWSGEPPADIATEVAGKTDGNRPSQAAKKESAVTISEG